MTSPLKSLWGWNPAHCSGDNPELQLTLPDTDPQDMVAKKRGSADPSFTEDDFVLFLEKCVHTGIFELAAKRGFLFGLDGKVEIHYKLHESLMTECLKKKNGIFP